MLTKMLTKIYLELKRMKNFQIEKDGNQKFKRNWTTSSK